VRTAQPACPSQTPRNQTAGRAEVSISAVVNTRNAAATLSEALQSLTPWVDELVVVDMHSTDATRDIAARHGARVLLHEPVGFVEPARAWSMQQATGEWIVNLDADEVIPRRLSERLRAIAARDEADIVDIPRINYFFGEPVLHGGWYPDDERQRRFFKKGTLDFSPVVHGAHRVADGARVLPLSYDRELAIVHFPYTTISEFIERTNRYTDVDVDAPPRTPLEQAGHVLHSTRTRLINQRGFRDGSRGFALALLMGVYESILWLKRLERHDPDALRSRRSARLAARAVSVTIALLKRLERRYWPTPDKIRSGYVSEARRLVAEYEPR
jgi:glycosyltransferase involved in cell wall biosynthesis